MKSTKIAIGADIGGSHITVAAVNMLTGLVVPGLYEKVHLDSGASAERVIQIWSDTIYSILEKINEPIVSIGFAMPGPFDYSEGICLIKNQNKYGHLYGLNVKKLLSDSLSISSHLFKFKNDALCFLEGERISGVAADYVNSVGITLGTGLGSAFVRDNVVVDGDLWNTPFKEGIAEDYISARFLVKRYAELTQLSVESGKELSLWAFDDKHPSQDIARKIFNELGGNLGCFINQIASEIRPDAVVLGGNVSESYNLFKDSMFQAITSDKKEIVVMPTQQGEFSAIIGSVF